MIKLDIRLLEKSYLISYFQEIGEPKFRASQVYSWLWKRSCIDFDQMTNLSKSLREKLKTHFSINPIQIDKVQYSLDGTIKSRFKLHDGHLIEAVLIPVQAEKRFTVCVSSQVGCSLTCSFCATGKMKRIRNLHAAEIYDQVILVNNQCIEKYGHKITNVVYMGMGEPLLNYKEVLRSVDLLCNEECWNMSPKRFTISTAGIAKMIRKLAEDEVRFNLALSLHAADDEKRNEIMPINEQNNLDTLMDALAYFNDQTGNKISYEYIAFNAFNDSIQDAKKLLKLCRRFPVHVNIIEYNQVEGVSLNKASQDRVDLFSEFLKKKHIMCTVRRSRGNDIDAACGQLANKG